MRHCNMRHHMHRTAILLLLFTFSLANLAGCGGKTLAEQYGKLFSLGEGLSYRSFEFRVQKPTTSPYPEQIDSRFAYTVSRQATHVEQVTEAAFDAAKPFTEDLGAVKVDGKWGFIRLKSDGFRAFEYAVPLTYEGAEPFSEGLAAVKQGGLYGYIDKTGKMVIMPAFTEAHYFSGGLAAVCDSSGWYFIDTTGKTVIKGPYEGAESFSGDRAPVKISGKWGYIDTTGQLVIKAVYEDAWSFDYYKTAAVKQNGVWKMINPNGGLA